MKEAIISMNDSLTPEIVRNFLDNDISDDDSYPLVQSKVIDGEWKIIALTDKVVHFMFSKIQNTRGFNDSGFSYDLQILEQRECSYLDAPREYHFLTPWIPFGRQSGLYYSDLTEDETREGFLEAILEKHLLDAAFVLGLITDQGLNLGLNLRETTAELDDGRTVIAFSGSFTADIMIPDYLGIGRGIREGFGTLQSA